MEPNWGGFSNYNYYSQDPSRSYDRTQPHQQPQGPGPAPLGATPLSDDTNSSSPHHQGGENRSRQPTMNSGPFLPLPPPQSLSNNSAHTSGGSPHMNLPPFSHAFYSSPSYHPSVSNFHSPPGLSSHIGLSTSFTGGSSAPPQQSGFGSSQDQYHPSAPSITSPSASTANSSFQRGLPVPASGPRGPHNYSESPRLGPGPLSYSSSPGMHHLSPTSPTTQMMPPGLFSHSTNSSSASSLFPNALRTPGGSKRKVERPGSVSPDAESWDESDKSGKPVIGEETDEQPWGMPQDQYKSLNPRDKKQVRNRIGARRFRAKRKDYVGNLEASLRKRDGEISSLRDQVDSYRNQINDLRSRLGMPALSPQISNSSSTPGLGLLMGQGAHDGWGKVEDD